MNTFIALGIPQAKICLSNGLNEETIKSRLSVYNEQTKPLIDFYEERKVLLNLNGEGNAKEVTECIISALEEIK